jgi:hypothetical protein
MMHKRAEANLFVLSFGAVLVGSFGSVSLGSVSFASIIFSFSDTLIASEIPP